MADKVAIDPGTGADGRPLERWPGHTASLDAAGIGTSVMELGEGADIVLLHGPGDNAVWWLDAMALLATTHHVVAPDLPGHGETEPVDGLDESRTVSWLDDVIASTCSGPPVLVGRVVGGAIAIRYCVEHPHAAARLVLVDTLGLASFDPAPPFGEALHRFMANPSGVTHAKLMEYCVHDFRAVQARLGDRWTALAAYTVDRATDPARRATIGALIERFGMLPIPDAALARITTPTSLIWGRHDLATPLRVAEAASEAFGWPLRVIDDAGDDPALEQPVTFVAALRDAMETGART